jgi:hypothetical protein
LVGHGIPADPDLFPLNVQFEDANTTMAAALQDFRAPIVALVAPA